MFLLLLTAATNGASAPRDEVKWLVMPIHRSTSLPAPALAAVGGRVLATYPDMHALELPSAAREQVSRHLEGFEVLELDDVIRTPRHTIDTRLERAPAAPFAAGLYVLQFTVPALPTWQAQLREQGIVTIESLAERAIIVAATAAQVAALRDLAWIQYVGPYLSTYKFAPVGAAEQDEFLVQMADTPLSRATITRIRARVGGFLTESAHGAQVVAHVKTSRTVARELLLEPFVLGVETYVPQSPSDERQALSVTGATSPLGGNYLNWLAARNITPANNQDFALFVINGTIN